MGRFTTDSGDHTRSQAGTTVVRRAARRGVSAALALKGPILRSTVDAGASVLPETGGLAGAQNLVYEFDRCVI